MIVLDVTAPVSIPLRFAAGVLAGLAATLAMDLVMARLPEGTTIPAIPSGVLTELPPQDAPRRLATVIHYLSGLLTGPLFVWLLFATEAVLDGPSLVTTAAAGVVLYALMVGFFAVVVLPRSLVFEGRVETIRRDWAVCALAYVLVLVPLVALVSRAL
jgi:TRAP-type C4-dicarboxylate transport system permease large subunit